MTSMTTMSPTPPVALTIAGVDSGGGAGIAADLRTFSAHGVFGALAITALTAQSTTGVRGTELTEPGFLALQIDTVLGDLGVAATKTGMLASAELIAVVTEQAAKGALGPLVVDPVMVATSGARLVAGDAIAAYHQLIAHASVVTPNLSEAEALTGHRVRSLEEMRTAAREVVALGAQCCLVKGGHLVGDQAIDLCFDGTDETVLSSPRIQSENVHGTGCTLSAAIAANLALGLGLLDAINRAKTYVAVAIERAAPWRLGAGPGPLDHFGPLPPSVLGT